MAGLSVGFIGLGTMGAPMARNLLTAGFSVTVHNRTRSKEEPLEAAGAARATSPGRAAGHADVVITMVSDTPDVEEVLFGSGGVAELAREGTVVVDMSTISPDATRAFGERLAERGIGFVDAPVSGGSEGAENATLTIMAGGEAADVERVRPVLEVLGSKVTHIGPLGSGQLTKAVNQIIIGGYFLALAEGITFGMKSGLDMDKVLEALSQGMSRSAVLEMRSANMLRDEYPLGFKLSLHLKDLGIALDTAKANGVDLPLTDLVAAIERSLVEARGDEDLSVVAAEIRRRAGL
ncbi:MAG: NAD(P)-dependent oxidoreductase [Actinomycetota bacterium]